MSKKFIEVIVLLLKVCILGYKSSLDITLTLKMLTKLLMGQKYIQFIIRQCGECFTEI
jgi:hypothetical protein